MREIKTVDTEILSKGRQGRFAPWPYGASMFLYNIYCLYKEYSDDFAERRLEQKLLDTRREWDLAQKEQEISLEEREKNLAKRERSVKTK